MIWWHLVCQVLDESLHVLADIEGLIRESIGLEPEAPLDSQDAGLMAHVPEPLLTALEVSIMHG